MTFPDREQLLTRPVSAYIERKGYTRQRLQLAFYEYRIDIYGFSHSTDRTMAVELKLRRWRKAFEQALIYQLCSDLVYIALPVQVVPRIDLPSLDSHGIGLIAVDYPKRCRQIMPARQSTCLRPEYRDRYIEMLQEETLCRSNGLK